MKAFRILTLLELQRNDAHADQIATMDSLEALGQNGFDSEQKRTFSRPICLRR